MKKKKEKAKTKTILNRVNKTALKLKLFYLGVNGEYDRQGERKHYT